MDRLPRLVVALNFLLLFASLSASNIYYSLHDDYSFCAPLVIASCNALSIVAIQLLSKKLTQKTS
jgi:hypothetical protein